MDSGHVNAAQRVTARIKARLEELGMTGREFAKKLAHKDAWISNLLSNKFSLSLTEIDQAAAILRVPAGELVREADEAWDLTPTERRVVRGLRLLPPVVRDHVAIHVEYLVGVTPDEVDLLQKIRRLTTPELERVRHYVRVVPLLQGTGHEITDGPDLPATTVRPNEPTAHGRKRRGA